MLKNLTLYRTASTAYLSTIEANASERAFTPCATTQPKSLGWTPPRGDAHGAMTECINGHTLLKLKTESRQLPAEVVKRRVGEILQTIEQTTGRRPGRKEAREIKEQAVLELLPNAFTRQSTTMVWAAPLAGRAAVDASSATRADDAITHLIHTADNLALSPIHTAISPAKAMAEWLVCGDPPDGFTVDRDCELKSTDEMKSVVRYGRHGLDIREVGDHIIKQGKIPTRLAMTWRDRVSFVLTDTLQLKKITFLDGVYEGRPSDSTEDEFDADAAIATGELSALIDDLIEALGGEQAPQEVGAA